jgi:membrane protease YdiL (CAAX protease family)
VLFVLWHVVVTWQGLRQTNLADASLPLWLIYIAAAVPLAVAGVVFSFLRQNTGNLAGPFVAHTLVNTLMQGSLILLGSGALAR